MPFVLMEVGHWPEATGKGAGGKIVSVVVRVMVGDEEGHTEVREGPAHWVLAEGSVGAVRERLVADVAAVRKRRGEDG